MESSVIRAHPDGRDLLAVLGFVVAVNALGAAPALLAGPDSAWFAGLAKPSLYPPPATFGAAWTLLFTLQGAALWLVWRAPAGRVRRVALAAFAVQFALNLAWTPVFFGLQAMLAALGVVLALLVVLLGTVGAFARVDRRAALLLVPTSPGSRSPRC